MIKNLHIENIALISSLDIAFDKGLVVLSGETGAGKSIIIDSLSFVLGDRADKTLIKHGEEKAYVEVCFELTDGSKTFDVLEELGYEKDELLIISRTLTMSGKNECRVNGRLCPASMLRQITSTLVDIFGQSQHLNLLKVDSHIKVLDDYHGQTEIKEQIKTLYSKYKDIEKQLSQFGGGMQERERLMDMLRFQINEISSAKISVQEEANIAEARARYQNIERIASAVSNALNMLNSASTDTVLAEARSSLMPARQFDKQVDYLAERLSSVQIELNDIISELEEVLAATDYNPSEIDRLEERAEKYRNLKKKYGGSVEEVLAFYQNSVEKLSNLENAAEIIEKLNAQKKKLASEIYELSKQLSNIRKQAAAHFKEEIESQLCDLGMKGTTFEVFFSNQPTLEEFEDNVTNGGFDKAEFLLSPNKGEPLKPLAKIISGGEMSRFMLAIKNITARIEQIPTMVFDEIDMGISGSMAQMVAKKLASVSRDYQCIVITHLPQIAAMGDLNMLISKHTQGERTVTNLKILTHEEKAKEIARLMGAHNIGEYSELNAKEMIKWADQYKESL